MKAKWTEANAGGARAMADALAKIAKDEGESEEMGCAAAALVVIWPDGSFSYCGVTGQIGANLAIASAMRIQSARIMGDVHQLMDIHHAETARAGAEAKARQAAGEKTN